jgi:hypothetical protein
MKRALVLSLAVIVGLGLVAFGQTLSGSWTTKITIDPQSQTQTFKAFSSTITVDYSLSGWTFGSLTKLSLTGWTEQQFSFGGALGAFTLDGTLDFDPNVPAAMFGYLLVDGGVSIAGVTFGFTWLLEDMDVALELTGSGVAGLVTIDVTVGFGDMDVMPNEVEALYGYTQDNPVPPADGADICDLPWRSITIGVDFPFCCADVTGTVAFDCNGFKSACFQVNDISFGYLPWLTLDAKVCFARAGTVEAWTYDKSFYFRPGFDLGDIACFDVTFVWAANVDAYGWTAADSILTIGDLTLDGIVLECEIGGITFIGATYLGEDPYWNGPSILAYTDWYEAYQIATTQDACCGPFDFDLTFYFGKELPTLFEIGEVIANISYDLGANFTFTTGLDVMMAGGFTEWTVGFTVTW